MKKVTSRLMLFLALTGSLLLAGCTPDARLQGRWQSNKMLTVATLPEKKPLTPEKRAKVEALFGKLALTYAKGSVTMELPGENGEPASEAKARYQVTASDRNTLTLTTFDSAEGKREVRLLHFVGPDRYWVKLGDSGAKEYFDRVSPSEETR